MDPVLRRAYNAAFSDAVYARYRALLSERLGCEIHFRLAETPLFLPRALRERLVRSATEIVRQISAPPLVERLKRAVPAHLDVPGLDGLPACTQVDFAIVRGADGELDGRVVELQAFPSLYALMVVQSETFADVMRPMPGLDRDWTIFFGGLDREGFRALFRRTVLADEDPDSVVLLDLDPPCQKTYPDFAATRLLFGIDAVCPTEVVRDGRRLLRRKGGRLVELRRIYNRVVFDELEVKKVALPFSYTDELDVTWIPHPNWYWIWSKYTLPHVDHPAVPRARYLSDVARLPDDLGRFVLKPLFSFAGSGVKVDPTPDDVAAIPAADRGRWLLQEKVAYAPALAMPDGGGVKAEVRMMFLRPPGEEPRLVLNLARLSRGKMLGVDQNKDLTWVGGSVGMWPRADEAGG
jgi:hypothetical protein